MELCEEFFRSTQPPDDLSSVSDDVLRFVTKHHTSGRCIALVAVSMLHFNYYYHDYVVTIV